MLTARIAVLTDLAIIARRSLVRVSRVQVLRRLPSLAGTSLEIGSIRVEPASRIQIVLSSRRLAVRRSAVIAFLPSVFALAIQVARMRAIDHRDGLGRARVGRVEEALRRFQVLHLLPQHRILAQQVVVLHLVLLQEFAQRTQFLLHMPVGAAATRQAARCLLAGRELTHVWR